jgi:DNA topoisomerase IB
VQATGVDAKGRRQYRYHDAWRLQRDLVKHDRVLEFAARLPAAASGCSSTCAPPTR